MPTTPQDHKRPHAETANEPFEFKHDGETYTLPPSSAIKAGTMRRIRKLDELDLMFSLVEELADERTLAALDDMDADTFNDVIGDWMESFGATPGKS